MNLCPISLKTEHRESTFKPRSSRVLALYSKGMKFMLKVMQQTYIGNKPNIIWLTKYLFISYSQSSRIISMNIMLFFHYKVKENNFTYSRWAPQNIFSIYSFWYESKDSILHFPMSCLTVWPWFVLFDCVLKWIK